MSLPKIEPVADAAAGAASSGPYDAVILVSADVSQHEHPEVNRLLQERSAIDARQAHCLHLMSAPSLAGGRLIVAPTGPLLRDQDDVRRFADAARGGILRARDAGARRPLLWVGGSPSDPRYREAGAVAVLGALGGLWEPIEAREALGELELEPMETLGVVAPNAARWLPRIAAIERGRRVARDIGGTDPERMAPPRVAEYCHRLFDGTPVSVEVVSELDVLAREYPLLHAVARASLSVERHRPHVVRLEYDPGDVERTLLFAGKGLTYDTGGADLKAGGHMAGMSRDKCGGAAVAGLLATIADLRPAGLRVRVEIGAVRNSIGADAYVSDEILVSHAGTRVRVGNTDAEGRLVLADLLSHLREAALVAQEPALFSVATLTGHSARAVGQYSIAVENGPARALEIARRLEDAGDRWGDPFDPSRLRREDWDFVAPRSRADDVLSCNNLPSTATNRGHQFPMAFLALASGLSHHGGDSERPLPFTHLDIGGSALEGSDWQHGRPTGAPIPALVAAFLE